MNIIDLRSDTVTLPTESMRQAAAEAVVGDDVYGEDPTVNELEAYAAKLLGKEDALLVTSGTQGNLVSILAQTKNGDNVVLEEESHIYYYEVGGLSAVGGTIPHPIASDKGYIPKMKLEKWFQKYARSEDIHYAKPTLLCLENTHNRYGGIALSPQQLNDMSSIARDFGVKTHLDGARLFNAVSYHNVDPIDFTKHVNSVQICLSKGLSAPIGSIVAGTTEFINEARRKRKLLGGGMRQAGVIAAPGLIALKEMRDRLIVDHINARSLAEGLREMGISVWETQTNIVICDISNLKTIKSSYDGVKLLGEKGVKSGAVDDNKIRMITHRHITEDNINETLEIVAKSWFN